jgi:hypothetical protein
VGTTRDRTIGLIDPPPVLATPTLDGAIPPASVAGGAEAAPAVEAVSSPATTATPADPAAVRVRVERDAVRRDMRDFLHRSDCWGRSDVSEGLCAGDNAYGSALENPLRITPLWFRSHIPKYVLLMGSFDCDARAIAR